jgi:hypothetical protein
MKKTLRRISGVLALAFLAAAPAVRAQDALLVNIPFAFTAGQMTLPAGEYRIQKVGDNSPALLIQRTDRSAAELVMSMAVDTNRKQPEQSKAVFHKYGERYFLAQIWTTGLQGRQLLESAKEKEQALVAHDQRPEQITIVARLTPKP